MYRLIAVDVDGTLVNSKGDISEAVRMALVEVSKVGVQIVVVSGRSVQGIHNILSRLGLGLWYVSSGGANISNYHNNIVIGQYSLSFSDAKSVIQTARAGHAGIFMELIDQLYWEGPTQYFNRLTSIKGLYIQFKDDVLKYMVTAPLKVTLVAERRELGNIERELRDKGLELNIVYSTEISLEVTGKGVNKGTAIKRLADYLEIPLSEVAAVGDGENDIPMFEAVGLPIAMGNAPDKVKQAARMVVPSNDADGLVSAIQMLDVLK